VVPVVLQGKLPDASGDGDGSGDGGDGSGDGYGYGDGDGSGDGSGYGSGDGYGYGYGDGSGDGSAGYGSGYGDGSGDGSGYGYGSYWLSCIAYFATKWSDAERARFVAAKKLKAKIAIWRSDANGQPSNNGGKIEAAAPGVIHTAPGPLNLCNKGTLHATLIPPKWKGERWWVVALHGKVIGDDEKFGCLKREIIGECI
jgi:hypothetical protein